MAAMNNLNDFTKEQLARLLQKATDGARLERSFARCLGMTALYEQRREKTSKKHKKD